MKFITMRACGSEEQDTVCKDDPRASDIPAVLLAPLHSTLKVRLVGLHVARFHPNQIDCHRKLAARSFAAVTYLK